MAVRRRHWRGLGASACAAACVVTLSAAARPGVAAGSAWPATPTVSLVAQGGADPFNEISANPPACPGSKSSPQPVYRDTRFTFPSAPPTWCRA
jgi:hypothetical protein